MRMWRIFGEKSMKRIVLVLILFAAASMFATGVARAQS